MLVAAGGGAEPAEAVLVPNRAARAVEGATKLVRKNASRTTLS